MKSFKKTFLLKNKTNRIGNISVAKTISFLQNSSDSRARATLQRAPKCPLLGLNLFGLI